MIRSKLSLLFLFFNLSFTSPAWGTLYLEKTHGLKFTDSVNKNFWCKISLLVKIDSYSFAERYVGGGHLRNNGSNIRKAEVSISGNLNNHWGYLFKLDWNTFYAKYSGFGKDLLFYFGQVIIPFGLENASSSKWSPFLERSLPTYTFSPGYGVGASFRKIFCEHHMTLSGSLTHSAYNRTRTGHEALQKTLRITYVPIHETSQVLHFGISARYQRLWIPYRLRSLPEIRLRNNNTAFLSMEFRSLNYCSSLGLEFAYLRGPFCLQSEFMKALAPPSLAPKWQHCAGGYIQANYILTGETRHYDFNSGTFGRIRPESRQGAWDIAFRLSYLNLTMKQQNRKGGIEWSHTISLGWTVNDQVRIFGNYILASAKRASGQQRMMEIFGLRLQWLY